MISSLLSGPKGTQPRRRRRITGAVLALSLALSFAASGQTPTYTVAATLLPCYRLITEPFDALAEAMPADEYTFNQTSACQAPQEADPGGWIGGELQRTSYGFDPFHQCAVRGHE